MVEKTKKAFIVRDFKDAGTKKRFKVGEVPDLPAGMFSNYKAAGLVREPTAAEAAKAKPEA